MDIEKELARQGWRIVVGDPYPMGWIIFAGYLVAAAMCLYIGVSIVKQKNLNDIKKNCLFWFGLSIFMVLLGINKQLDLQTLFISIGRIIAHYHGWFDIRREVQKLFIIGLGFFSFLSLAAIMILFKKQFLENIFILIGIILVICFVLIRAATFNHITLIPHSLRIISFIHMKYVVESGSIILICFGAIRRIYRINKKYKYI